MKFTRNFGYNLINAVYSIQIKAVRDYYGINKNRRRLGIIKCKKKKKKKKKKNISCWQDESKLIKLKINEELRIILPTRNVHSI